MVPDFPIWVNCKTIKSLDYESLLAAMKFVSQKLKPVFIK